VRFVSIQLVKYTIEIYTIIEGSICIGYAIAERFVSEGVYVFIIDRNKKELDTAISEIGKNVSSVFKGMYPI